MELRMLRALVAVEAQGSIGGAARALAFSPAAVSGHLRALEAVCGARLVERTARGVRLTEAGRRAAPVARLVLAAAQELERVGTAAEAGRGPGRARTTRSHRHFQEDP